MGAVALPSTGTPPAHEHTGRPVDIEIIPRAHAILSASSAERWLTCTPSARIEESLADDKSSYASEGTAAHRFAEIELNLWLGNLTEDEAAAAEVATKLLYAEHIVEWTAFDWDAIASYVKFVKDRVAEYGGVFSASNPTGVQVIIEARVDYSIYAPEGFGTSDVLLVSGNLGLVEAVDLKFGKGVAVYAEDNPQPRLYTLGGFIRLAQADRETARKITRFRSVIHQPRLDNVSEAEITREEMIDWAENVVKPQAALAYEGKGELNPTAKGCRFCKARSTCRALAAKNIQLAQKEMAPFMSAPDADGVRHFDPSLFVLTPEEAARVLPEIDQFLAWGNRLKEFALEQARDHGVTIPGYKLVRGRSNRQWAVPDNAVAALLSQEGIDGEVIYEEPKPRAVRSVAQMEKKIGAKKFGELAEKNSLVDKPLGKPTLVPTADSRDAIDKVAEAASDFSFPLKTASEESSSGANE